MSLPQIPKAAVYDLRFLDSLPEFKYYLDTNILKFVFARTFVKEQSYQVTHYPAFFKKLLSHKKLMRFTFTQNLLELFSTLDYIEQDYLNTSIKKYRIEGINVFTANQKAIQAARRVKKLMN